MKSIPLWMRALRWYALHTPIQRGAYRLGLKLYQHLSIPDIKTTVTLDKTLNIKLNLRNWVDYNIYCLGLYEAPLARFFIHSIKTESVVLDIGAYIGQYTLLAAKYAKEGKVIALKPHPESYNCLKENISINNFKNAQAINAAASIRTGHSYFRLSSFNNSLIPEIQYDIDSILVSSVSIDDLVKSLNLDRLDLIKIDVEGHEGFVIRGAQETLTLFRPMLIVELSWEDEQVFGDTPEMVLDELRKFGYSFFTLHGSKMRPLTNFAGINYENIIAKPMIYELY